MITLQKQKCRAREFRGPEPGSVAILARQPGTRGADRIIEELKKEREYRAQCELEAKSNREASIRGDWESNSTKKMLQAATYRRFSTAKNQLLDDIELRKERMRQLVSEDAISMDTALESSHETVLERQATLREKARRLKEEKALDNEQVAQQKYSQMWRDQCEELRTVISKRTAMEIAKDNREILKQKENNVSIKQYEDEYFARLWHEDILKKEEREKRDEGKAIERNSEMMKILEEQKVLVEGKRRKEKELKDEEKRLRLEMLELKKLEVENSYEEKRQKQQQTREIFDSNLRQKLMRLNRLRQEEAAFDAKLMEKILADAEAEANVASDNKKKLIEDSRKYREYLASLRQREADRERELDALMNEEIARQWQKRLDQWDREGQTRKALLQEVIRIRQQQVQDKMSRNEEAQRAAAEDRVKFAVEVERMRVEDAEKQRLLRVKDRAYRGDLVGQINHNRQQEKHRQQELHREHEEMWKEEDRFRSRIEATLAEDWVDPHAHPWRKAQLSAADS